MYDFTYVWYLKIPKLTENRLVRGGVGVNKKDKGVRKEEYSVMAHDCKGTSAVG